MLDPKVLFENAEEIFDKVYNNELIRLGHPNKDMRYMHKPPIRDDSDYKKHPFVKGGTEGKAKHFARMISKDQREKLRYSPQSDISTPEARVHYKAVVDKDVPSKVTKKYSEMQHSKPAKEYVGQRK